MGRIRPRRPALRLPWVLIAGLFALGTMSAVAAVLPAGSGGGIDPSFVPAIDPEMYALDLDDPNVVDDVLQDDGYMQEDPDDVTGPGLVTSDRQHLAQYQDYAHFNEIIDN